MDLIYVFCEVTRVAECFHTDSKFIIYICKLSEILAMGSYAFHKLYIKSIYIIVKKLNMR